MENRALSLVVTQSCVDEAEGRLISALGSPPGLQTQPWAQPKQQQPPLGISSARPCAPSPPHPLGPSVLQGQFSAGSEVTRGWLYL